MKFKRNALSAALCLAAGAAQAGTLQTLYTFTGGPDGGAPFAGLLAGPHGTFFGTTTANAGTIFELAPPKPGQTKWTLTTLYTFANTTDGDFPQTLIRDTSGALYGMADHGGLRNGACAQNGVDIGCGTVFRLAPPAPGQTQWQFSVLWSFTGGKDGSSPTGGVTFGPDGSLYGFTYGGFSCGHGVCGGVYRLDPPPPGGAQWSETTLYSFTGGADGGLAGSYGAPVLGEDGTIYGETGIGGDVRSAACRTNGCGTVFAVSRDKGDGGWRKRTLLTFRGHDGDQPVGGLTIDRRGTLYGATNEGGALARCVPGGGFPNGCGAAFALSPASDGAFAETTLRRFGNGADGSYPFAAPIRIGDTIYATTTGDGVKTFGSLDALPLPGLPAAHVAGFVFKNDADGASPVCTLTPRAGKLYGTTIGVGSGPAPYGTIFAYTP